MSTNNTPISSKISIVKVPVTNPKSGPSITKKIDTIDNERPVKAIPNPTASITSKIDTINERPVLAIPNPSAIITSKIDINNERPVLAMPEPSVKITSKIDTDTIERPVQVLSEISTIVTKIDSERPVLATVNTTGTDIKRGLVQTKDIYAVDPFLVDVAFDIDVNFSCDFNFEFAVGVDFDFEGAFG